MQEILWKKSYSIMVQAMHFVSKLSHVRIFQEEKKTSANKEKQRKTKILEDYVQNVEKMFNI